MLGRAMLTVAAVVLVAPHEPDVGLGQPAARPLARIQSLVLAAIDRVRSDIEHHRWDRATHAPRLAAQ